MAPQIFTSKLIDSLTTVVATECGLVAELRLIRFVLNRVP